MSKRQGLSTPSSELGAAVDDMIVALARYAQAHEWRYRRKLGEDNVLGAGAQQIIDGVLTLLDGELGERSRDVLCDRLFEISEKHAIHGADE